MAPADWSDTFLDAMRQHGDSVADRAVKALFDAADVDAVNRLLGTLLAGTIPADAPAPLFTYLADTAELPTWTDFRKIAIAEQLTVDYGFLCAGVLYTSGLPTSYASRGIAAVLATTLRLEQRDLIFRRLIETGQFVFNVSDRGGMRVEGVGVRTTQQVRLMHAAIRHLILTPPRAPAPGAPSLGRTLLAMQWDPALGVPINQQELAWTLLTFSFSVLRALEQFGAVLTVEQKDAYIHLWSVVGHVLGVDGRLLCADFAEARALFERLEPRVTGNTPQGRGLITSLVDFTQPVLYPSFVRALIRYHVGERLAVLLGVRATGVGRLLRDGGSGHDAISDRAHHVSLSRVVRAQVARQSGNPPHRRASGQPLPRPRPRTIPAPEAAGGATRTAIASRSDWFQPNPVIIPVVVARRGLRAQSRLIRHHRTRARALPSFARATRCLAAPCRVSAAITASRPWSPPMSSPYRLRAAAA